MIHVLLVLHSSSTLQVLPGRPHAYYGTAHLRGAPPIIDAPVIAVGHQLQGDFVVATSSQTQTPVSVSVSQGGDESPTTNSVSEHASPSPTLRGPLKTPANDLIDACSAGDLDRVLAILEGSAASSGAQGSTIPSINAPVPPSNSLPLLAAASRGKDNVVNFLLDRGAIVDLRNVEGETALLLASLNGHLDTCRTLLDRDADVSLADRDGWTALHNAASRGHREIVRLLLERRADPNARNSVGTTPLMSAITSPDILNDLLKAGADPLLLNTYGDSAYDLSAQSELLQSCQLLESHESKHLPPNQRPKRSAQLALLHENQRSTVLSPRSFSASNLARSDIRGPFSTPTCKPLHPDSYHLPLETDPKTGEKKREWYWLSEWHPDPDHYNTDEEGWEYARDFEDSEWAPGMPANVTLGTWVRRRRWIRAMKRRKEEVGGASAAGGNEREDKVDYLEKAKGLLGEGAARPETVERALQILLAGISADRNGKRKQEASDLARRLLEQAEAEAEARMDTESVASGPVSVVGSAAEEPTRPPPPPVAKSSRAPRTEQPLPSAPPSASQPTDLLGTIEIDIPTTSSASRLQAPATTWQLDQDAPQCNSCGKKFSMFLRRHHCRWCGKIYCAACTSRKLSFSRTDTSVMHRVDDACYAFLTGPSSPLLQRPSSSKKSRKPARIDASRLPSTDSTSSSARPLSTADSLILCPACSTSLSDFPTEEARESHIRSCLESASAPLSLRYTTKTLSSDLEERECGICYEEFTKGQKIATLNCLCIYHERCILGWVERGGMGCPVHAADG